MPMEYHDYSQEDYINTDQEMEDIHETEITN